MTLDEAFARLARSPFRSRFRLSEKDRAYIREKGLGTVRRHAEDFVRLKLAHASPANDGKQTPMRGDLLPGLPEQVVEGSAWRPPLGRPAGQGRRPDHGLDREAVEGLMSRPVGTAVPAVRGGNVEG